MTPVESEKVETIFSYTGKNETVCLSGDFNGWSDKSHCLKRQGENWEIRILLPPGRYRYAFVLDGERWVPDSRAALQEDDGFGTINSILIVE
ncbi:MAG: isoamylase early set domain-containing protein [Deltaproteobacteria bacterium]|nr:isoamylase early set domain-containing protein [Deltaproteobacteria bacterium]MBW2053206.1 isoamylase early set domain-containing protein [Deltaproteobacteria bacterium]MBW2142368.1 isoamylase early set domain-containing protein [Deltaproteobacteria bacterium]MBW2324652.1 isoamylase early set domain-containing protein [Deltaproteobacteria bacterium]